MQLAQTIELHTAKQKVKAFAQDPMKRFFLDASGKMKCSKCGALLEGIQNAQNHWTETHGKKTGKKMKAGGPGSGRRPGSQFERKNQGYQPKQETEKPVLKMPGRDNRNLTEGLRKSSPWMQGGGPGSGRHPEFGKFKKDLTNRTGTDKTVNYTSPKGRAVWVTEIGKSNSVWVIHTNGKDTHYKTKSVADKVLKNRYGINHKFD